MRKATLFLFTILLSSCWSYRNVQEVYPEHFAIPAEKIHHRQLPSDIYNSLPGDFRLANQLGYMTTYVYNDGYIAYRPSSDNYNRRKLIKSGYINGKYNELAQAGYNIYVPIQFPHVICCYPDDIDLVDRFEKEASIDIVMALNLIHNNDSALDLADVEIERIIETTAEQNTKLDNINKLITEKEQEQQQWEQRNQNLAAQIKELDKQIGSFRLESATSDKNKLSDNLYDHINLEEIRISTKNDPFLGAHVAAQTDISAKPYNTANTSKNGYPMLDNDMAAAMDRFYDKLKNPSRLKKEGFSDDEVKELEAWAADKTNDIQINSAARSPQHQLGIKNPRKAGTLNSKHLLGVAVDIQLKGKAYNPQKNPKAYGLLRKVALSAGLNFPMPTDNVESIHAVLDGYQDGQAPNKAPYCGKLADLLSGYDKGIGTELASQKSQQATKDKVKGNLNEKLADIQGKVQDKLKQVNAINTKIADLMAQYGMFSDQFQEKSNKLCSMLAAKDKAASEKSHEREYNPRGDRNFNRPGEKTGGDRPKEKPNREFGPTRSFRPT